VTAYIPPTLADIRAAAKRIAPYIRKTPVRTSPGLDALAGGTLCFKCENLQTVGAFKMRGASNAVAQLDAASRSRGVATHSSGNHGAALALAAHNFGIQCWVVMPETAPEVKKNAVRNYGAEVRFCKPTLAARDELLKEVVAETGATVIHPYDNDQIIAGQGTAALELLEEVPDLDLVVVPIGGGGLISGTAIVVKALSPKTRVIGVEPAAADDARRSLEADRIVPAMEPKSIADGLLAQLSERTFAIIRKNVDQIVAVSEEGILKALRLITDRLEIPVEPSAAVTLAAVLSGKIDVRSKRAALILSGGNFDPRLPPE
jgi:threonine dehydratase